MRQSSWRWLDQDCGAQIAEFAAVVPLLVTLIFGVLWFGRAFNIYTTVHHAARAAAEAAAIRTCATCSNALPSKATIQTTVVDPIFRAAHLDSSPATLDLSQGKPLDPNSTVFGPLVTISYPYNFKLNSPTCCPPGLKRIEVGLIMTARAQAQEEN